MWRLNKVHPFQKLGNIYFHGNRNKKEIAITFDDGPSKETEKILDILKKEKCRATFFVLGKKIRKNRKIIQRMIKEGHEIGNHSFNHYDLEKKDYRLILSELVKTDEELKKVGITPKVFRAPYHHIGLNVIRVCKKLDKKIIVADIFSGDWNRQKTDEEVTKEVLSKTKKGSIINFHDYAEDVGRNKRIVEIIKKVVLALKKKYKLVTVSELLEL